MFIVTYDPVAGFGHYKDWGVTRIEKREKEAKN